MAVYSAMDGSAIKGSKGDQTWQYTVQCWNGPAARGPNVAVYTVQWIVQLL